MLIWFLLALGAAITHSWHQVIQKWALRLSQYSKFTITFVATAAASLILFLISYFIIGLPIIDNRFWPAILVTGVLNLIAFPLMLRAYQLGEFSSVYSMILLTPVFLLGTSFFILGEAPSIIGILGVVLTILGLWVITKRKDEPSAVPDFKRGNFLGILVAFIFSITVNFDKLAAQYSDRFFAPATALAIMAVGGLFYLLYKHKKILVKTPVSFPKENNSWGLGLLLVLGAVIALSNVFHNSALLTGFASYTIAVKRMGVLFGVLWGWLFFHEKNILKKLFGAVIAILGVIAIIFS